MAVDLSASPALFSIIVSLCAYVLYNRLTYRSTLPSDLPWVGCSSNWLSRIKGRFLSTWNGQMLLKRVYDQVRREGLKDLNLIGAHAEKIVSTLAKV